MTTNGISSEAVKEEPSTSSSFSNFSIDHILHKAGDRCRKSAVSANGTLYESVNFTLDQFSWLHCTRYCPPKIPRSQRKDAPQRRQMGRHPRIPFTSQQLYILEQKFQQTAYLTGDEVVELARKLQLADIRVKIWFQNRRARDRREKFSTDTLNVRPATETSSTIKIRRLEDEARSHFHDFRFPTDNNGET